MYRQGAVGALLDIYELAISDFKKVLEDIPDDALTIIIDPKTDENCKSIQKILSHVVSSGYGYATSIIIKKDMTSGDPIKPFILQLRNIWKTWLAFIFIQKIFLERLKTMN